ADPRCRSAAVRRVEPGGRLTHASSSTVENERRRPLTVIARKVPLLDLQAQHRQIRDEVLKEVVRVVDSQMFILGEDVKKLEQETAAYCESKYAIGCASGSDALVLALMALDIKPGDEVLTTPYSFFATAGAVSRVGATPVFADVEEDTFNIDVDRLA